MASRFFRAITAEARAAAGEFKLFERPLRVFSLLHWTVLDEVLGAEWMCREPDLATLDFLAHVCAQELPTGDFPERTPEEVAVLQEYDPEEEVEAWEAYLHACWDSRPRTMRARGGKSADWRSPDPQLMATFIQRHIAVDSLELWSRWSVGRVHWQFESIREQVGEYSLLCLTDEPPPEPTAEEKAAKASYQQLAQKVIRHCSGLTAALGKKKLTGARLARANAIRAEQARLLALARKGKLRDDLTEIPAEVMAPAAG